MKNNTIWFKTVARDKCLGQKLSLPKSPNTRETSLPALYMCLVNLLIEIPYSARMSQPPNLTAKVDKLSLTKRFQMVNTSNMPANVEEGLTNYSSCSTMKGVPKGLLMITSP